jgi:hypothetical protein
MHASEPRSDPAPDATLLPPKIRHLTYGILGLLLALAGYLVIVRGPALLFDLSQMASMFCF